MAGTALDLSGVNVGQAVEKMSNQILGAAKFDYEKREKTRLEFMSDLELSELNQNLSLRNSATAIGEIDKFKDKWYNIYEERNGRLNDRDRLDMRKDKQNIERTITRYNAIQTEYERATQEIRYGRNSHQYNRDVYEDRAKKWIEEGVMPEEGRFLELRPIDFETYLRNVNYPRKYNESKISIWNPKTKSTETEIVQTYSDDNYRMAYIKELMLSDQQFSMGVMQRFRELDPEIQEEYYRDTEGTNESPYVLFAQETGKDFLWQDVRRLSDTQSVSSINASQKPPPATPVQGSYEAGIVSRSDGYQISHLGMNISRGTTIEGARNVETGEAENISMTSDVVNFVYFVQGDGNDDPTLYIRVKRDNYRRPIRTPGGELQYAVVNPAGGVKTGTKEDMEKLAKEGDQVIQQFSRATTEEVDYEIPIKDKKNAQFAEVMKGLGIPLYRTNKPKPKISVSSESPINNPIK